ncbi:iron-containing redox enzyme family protein [Kineococcus glutinatus]|uniref:Iron-containing redox enzyme family protein n=1 Tax=Kineococcus glutinatus TaxID=1070872 RepID=A0ABP8VGW6_9ACTN
MTATLPAPPAPATPAAPGTGDALRMPLPAARGPLSAALREVLTGTRPAADLLPLARTAATAQDPLREEDLQIALTVLYELHYRGLRGVSDDWEWDGDLLAARAVLEAAVEAALRALVAVPDAAPDEVAETLFAMAADDSGPAVSRFLCRSATPEQFREFLVHRSIYHLKEADPHTWAIPRLSGVPKAALVEVQADEYGGGRPDRMHAALFARTMRAAGLDDGYGRYVDEVPATTLVATNALSMFGLHRRLAAAAVGHLAVFEMTSSIPNKLYGNGMRRLGFDADATWFFDEHVEADAVHEQIAGRDLAQGLARQQPGLTGEVLFGAAACLALDAVAGAHQLRCWEAGRPSLRA